MITLHLYYTGENGAARAFAEEMTRRGVVDAILLTGGLVRFPDIPDGIRDRCGWIAPVSVYPGEMEQSALALSVLRALRGEEPILSYSGRPVFPGFSSIGL